MPPKRYGVYDSAISPASKLPSVDPRARERETQMNSRKRHLLAFFGLLTIVVAPARAETKPVKPPKPSGAAEIRNIGPVGPVGMRVTVGAPTGPAPASPPPSVLPAPPAPPSGPVGTLEISETTFDAGKIQRGEKVEHVFTLKNTGKGDLTVDARPG